MAKKQRNVSVGKGAFGAVIQPKKRINGKLLAIIITSAVLLVTITTAIVWFVIDSLQNNKNFNYLTSDLTEYISFSAPGYKDYKAELKIARPHEIDTDIAILNLLSSDKYRELEHEGATYKNKTVTAGDKLRIWYRGYLVEEDGTKVEIMRNFASQTPQELIIGQLNAAMLPVGLDFGLVGKNPADYAEFEKITTGTVSEDQIIYLTYSRHLKEDKNKDKASGEYMRIDLSDPKVDEEWGEGFRAAVIGKTIGVDFSINAKITEDEKEKEYTYNAKVAFATTCEKEETSKNGKAPINVECYFAYSYGYDGTSSANLRNETVYFDVYVESVTCYKTPEFNDDFVRELLSEEDSPITEEALGEYEGSTLTDKYTSYVKELLDESYDEEYTKLLEQTMWQYCLSIAEVKKYPKSKVDEVHKQYIDDVYWQYDHSGGGLQEQDQYTGDYKTVFYETVDEFAVAYLKLSNEKNPDWRAALYSISESLVKERLVLYYILRYENLMPSDEVFNSTFNEIKQEYFDEYVYMYLENEEKTAEDYGGEGSEEYEKFLSDRSKEYFDIYGDDEFEEKTYYTLLLKGISKAPFVTKVTTYDEKRAYPVTK